MDDPIFIQILAALPVLNYFADFYHHVIPQADTKTGNWALMSSPDIPVSVVVVYLFTVVILGSLYIRYLKIPDLLIRKVLVVYNSFVLTLNLWLGISFTWHIFRAGYQLGCQKVNKFGMHEHAIASLLWVFHCSKIIELTDTLFLVLKKKGNQLTFLHLYHHSTIVVATWIGVKFVPGGSSAVIAMVNSWIHVFMYFYYEMMVLRVKSFRNYKKFVTILQIVQFLATIVHCTTALRRNCGYPKWILTWLLLYMISFLILFVHFYVQTYWKPKKSHHITGNSQATIEYEETVEEETSSEQIGHSSTAFSDDEDQEVTSSKEYNKVDSTNNEDVSQLVGNIRLNNTNGDFGIVQSGEIVAWDNLEESDEMISDETSESSDISLDINENEEDRGANLVHSTSS